MIIDQREDRTGRPHSLVLEDREKLSVTGVDEVESFDEERIILKTSRGALILRGTELHIDKLSLDSGELYVTGLVSDLGYEETSAAPAGFWSRLFK